MVLHEDPLKTFIPKRKTAFVILGTMVAINARVIDGDAPVEQTFYYNNDRNHFWRVLQALMVPDKEAKKNLTISEKKSFLEHHGVAICNLVQQVEVPNKHKLDPSDIVLFDAYKKGRIRYKTIPKKVKEILTTVPLYFTCRRKKGIDLLLEGFLTANNIDLALRERIWYWATPTRCNPQARAEMWREEMIAFEKEFF